MTPLLREKSEVMNEMMWEEGLGKDGERWAKAGRNRDMMVPAA